MLVALVTSLLLGGACAVLPSSSSSDNDIFKQQRRQAASTGSALYPQATLTRDVVKLDGIWEFRKSPSADPEYGYQRGWFRQDLSQTGPVIPMPVPSSYNDVGTDSSLRDHVGLVWYSRRFTVPRSWIQEDKRIWLRFSSVHYAAQVWVNGERVAYHEIGHLPFEAEITSVVRVNTTNLLTVVVDNTLLSDTVPQGRLMHEQVGGRSKLLQHYTFDFFNYAGIHRSVYLLATPRLHIDDIVVNTDIQGHTGFVVYNVSYSGGADPADLPEGVAGVEGVGGDVSCVVQLLDRNGSQVAGLQDCAGLIEVAGASFWWPLFMHDHPGYLYEMKVSLVGNRGDLIDTYSQRVGIRTLTWTNTSMFINDKPLYMRGFGMHEDSDFRGKGWDSVLWVKNFNLLKWSGANSFRTSHYPYAEEVYHLADELGFMILDECPSVDTDQFSEGLLSKHKQSLTELIRRDKNHPSVVLWSIANEPRTQNQLADAYFESVVKHVKSMDLSRPVSLAMAQPIDKDKAAKHLDIIMFNRYNSWYNSPGDLSTITSGVISEAATWHAKYNRPVLMTEYGADAIAGMHLYPEYMWSEEYQASCLSEHFKAFDQLRKRGYFIGEFVWNFADFNTAQTTGRAGGNKKGVFTRARQPKMAAHILRARYHELAAADDAAAVAAVSYRLYTSDRLPAHHQEL